MTIVVDSSALLAVTFAEPDAALYASALLRNDVALSSATLTEALVVAEGRSGDRAIDVLNDLVQSAVDSIIPFGPDHARAAHAAWRRFGKGNHPARLNLGDCFSYATAKLAGVPLLFKGEDFAQTDIAAAV